MLHTSLNKQSSWQIHKSTPKYKDYVLVIGESMRMDYMSAYGFPLDTTPFLRQTKGKIYTGYISASANTINSLRQSFYQYTPDEQIVYENNIITLANQAGFETHWLSNQGFLGEYDTITSAVAVNADEYYFPAKAGFRSHKHIDRDLLPRFIETLKKSSNKNRLIVLHLVGSHRYFCERIWDKVEFDYINPNMSCYLQTIKQTDGLLEQIIAQLNALSPSYSLLYFSDHGLSFEHKHDKQNTTLGYSLAYKENFRVPLITVSSDDTQRQEITFKQSGRNFIQGFGEWLGIDFEHGGSDASFWQGTDKPLQIFYYGWATGWTNFDDLKPDPAIIP